MSQKKKLDKLHEELKMRGRMGFRGMHHQAMMGGMPDQLFATMKERLNLTKEQEEKIRPIMDASMEKSEPYLKNIGSKNERICAYWETTCRRLTRIWGNSSAQS